MFACVCLCHMYCTGSNVAALQTEAVLDVLTDEWVIHTPVRETWVTHTDTCLFLLCVLGSHAL